MSRAADRLRPGQDAIAQKGWLAAHKWLLLRRISQLGILALFLIGPGFQHFASWFAAGNHGADWPMLAALIEKIQDGGGLWLVKGNLASSLTLDTLPLTDPYIFLQILAAGFVPAATAVVGAAIVVVFYLLVGGRVFCAWVCPVNLVTDAAAWMRRRLGIKANHVPPAATRYGFLVGTFIAAAVTGTLAWEWFNPVAIAHRGLIFGMGAGGCFLLIVFIYDLLFAQRGWCGHLCPTGAFYSLLGRTALLRVSASRREACNDCMDCFAVCPEPQVIRPALKKAGQESPIIRAPLCTTCGRCIDVCSQKVFRLTHRFDRRSSS
ncbi:MAG: quinol dehydrogenase ferredoxin subunit NapH [Azoarcus sp.]|jgi:ferredoxin-type protein NapH|nr:quinol dehydrogenase ferredoxin subunit NapH [Azoarcus sp.]